ncbi:hypothetical protein FRC15_000213 [Serendipita sp. 397]|nr:hypothetical protein FRC15_000213 [Serendipita sp. 397]
MCSVPLLALADFRSTYGLPLRSAKGLNGGPATATAISAQSLSSVAKWFEEKANFLLVVSMSGKLPRRLSKFLSCTPPYSSQLLEILLEIEDVYRGKQLRCGRRSSSMIQSIIRIQSSVGS